jgi:hypothetical protein
MRRAVALVGWAVEFEVPVGEAWAGGCCAAPTSSREKETRWTRRVAVR